MRRRWVPPHAVWMAVGCVSALLVSTLQIHVTAALHSSRNVSPVQGFSGATFVPQSAPTITPTVASLGISLAWNRVTTSSGVDVTYRVVRTSSAGTTEVCTGTDAPVVSGGTVTCIDRTALADATYTYSEQPVLVRNATATWSRPTSAASPAVTAPRVLFAGAGPTVMSTGSPVTVAYPSGTQVGDVLLLVSVSGRQNAPSTPTGWTSVASVGVTGGSPLRLFIAWRVADAALLASPLTWDPNANGTGASVRIVRFAPASGNVAPPTIATALVATSSGASSTTFTPSVDVVTNASNAFVANIVAMRASANLSLSTANGFSLDYGLATTGGTVGQSVGLAGRQQLVAGQVTSPQWLADVASVWVSASVAFR